MLVQFDDVHGDSIVFLELQTMTSTDPTEPQEPQEPQEPIMLREPTEP
jgi:hypothetical protein